MAKLSFNSNSQSRNLLRVRIVSKLVVIFICVTVLIQRFIRTFTSASGSTKVAKGLMTTLPFLSSLSVIVLVECCLYRKLGLRLLKYTKYFDIVFTLVYTMEFMVTMNSHFGYIKADNVPFFIAVSFAAFSWRGLLPIITIQQWQLRTVPLIAAYIYFSYFVIANNPPQTFMILYGSISQLIYVVLIYYFMHKINFTMMIGNVQNEQWLQLNSFILNNIPENIAIMDSTGNPNFISESFKKLMERHNQSQEIKNFLKNIKQIQRVQGERENESDSDQAQDVLSLQRIPSSETRNDLPTDTNCDIQTISSLEDIIISFGNLIKKGSVKDQSLHIFTGKFRHAEEERSFEIKISFINQEPKKYIVLILRDTTHRDLLLTLEDNLKYKDQLLASVSHELRAPLNGNINLIEATLKSKEVPDKIKETFLTPAVRSSQFLLHLINDILDMSQIKAQKLRLVFQPASLRKTLNNTIQLIEFHAKKKGINLETNIDLKFPEIFCTDHMRLSQIVLNLINNSIKFTQKGYVKLSATPLKDTDYVNVSVEDTGIGMTPEDVNRLFQDFTHIDCNNREKINPSGVGLGLKIGNDLAKLLGPENNNGISVISELGKGSTFSFLIENKETGLNSQDIKIECKEEPSPLVPNEFHTAIEIGLESKMIRNISLKSLSSLTKIEIAPMPSASSCACPKILVVDDDPFNILAYEAILSSLGAKYECVYNGRSAIERMISKVRYPCSSVCCPYQLVFMDEEMPEMTGRETVTEIKNLQRQSLLPSMTIVGCTAHHEGEAIENFLKSGIAEYIPKPISVLVIQKILEKYKV